MGKRCFVTLALLTTGLMSQAFGQSSSSDRFDAGIKGGVSFMEVDLTEFQPVSDLDNLYSIERGVGYHAGVYTRFKMSILFIQPEIVFSQLNQRLYTEDPSGKTVITIDFNRLDFPILMGLELGPIRLGGGVVGSINIDDEKDVFNNTLKDVSYGYQLGIGLDVKNLSLDVRYEAALSNVATEIIIGSRSYYFDTRTNQLIFSLGINLF